MYYIYILRSVKSSQYYIGSSENIDIRVASHNSGKVKATKNKGPWVVIHSEIFNTRAQAVQREQYIKRMKSRRYIESLLAGGLKDKSRFKSGFP